MMQYFWICKAKAKKTQDKNWKKWMNLANKKTIHHFWVVFLNVSLLCGKKSCFPAGLVQIIIWSNEPNAERFEAQIWGPRFGRGFRPETFREI